MFHRRYPPGLIEGVPRRRKVPVSHALDQVVAKMRVIPPHENRHRVSRNAPLCVLHAIRRVKLSGRGPPMGDLRLFLHTLFHRVGQLLPAQEQRINAIGLGNPTILQLIVPLALGSHLA